MDGSRASALRGLERRSGGSARGLDGRPRRQHRRRHRRPRLRERQPARRRHPRRRPRVPRAHRRRALECDRHPGSSNKRADGGRPADGLAEVREGHKDREVAVADGREAVEFEVYKAADANIVRLSEAVRNRLGVDAQEASTPGRPRGPPTIADRLPDGMQMVVLEDQAGFIEASIENLRSTAVLGAFLAIGILFSSGTFGPRSSSRPRFRSPSSPPLLRCTSAVSAST